MKGNLLSESFVVLILCAATASGLAAYATAYASWRSFASISCLAIAVAITYLRLRLMAYPRIVGVIFVAAVFSSPHLVGAVSSANDEVFQFSLILAVWSLLPLMVLGSSYGLFAWIIGYSVALFACGVSPPWLTLTEAPEWHLVFVIASFVGLRHRSGDMLAICALAIPALLMPSPTQQAMFAPLVAIGVGRLLYRGTLTKSFRIPPAGWAMVLLTIAAIRSTVIMVTWAPHWDDYKNRIGLMIERPK